MNAPNPTGKEPSVQRLTRFVVAPLFVLGGLWFLALPFVFATMLDGGPDAPMTWREYLGAVWRGGASSLVIGILMILGGLYLGAARSSRPHSKSATGPLAGYD